MNLLTKNQAAYLENKYLHLTTLQNKVGKVKAVVTTSNELDDRFYKVIVVLFTEDPLNDGFMDLDQFCKVVEIEYDEA